MSLTSLSIPKIFNVTSLFPLSTIDSPVAVIIVSPYGKNTAKYSNGILAIKSIQNLPFT